FSSRRRHTRFSRDWSSDVCSSDLLHAGGRRQGGDSCLRHTYQLAQCNIGCPFLISWHAMIDSCQQLVLAATFGRGNGRGARYSSTLLTAFFATAFGLRLPETEETGYPGSVRKCKV